MTPPLARGQGAPRRPDRAGPPPPPRPRRISQDFPGPGLHNPAVSGSARGVPSAVSLMGVTKSPSGAHTTAAMHKRGPAPDPFEVVQRPPSAAVAAVAPAPAAGGADPAAAITGASAPPPEPADAAAATPGVPAWLPGLSTTLQSECHHVARSVKRRRAVSVDLRAPPRPDAGAEPEVSRHEDPGAAGAAPGADPAPPRTQLWAAVFHVLEDPREPGREARALCSELLGVFSSVARANAVCKERLKGYMRGEREGYMREGYMREASGVEGSSVAAGEWERGAGSQPSPGSGAGPSPQARAGPGGGEGSQPPPEGTPRALTHVGQTHTLGSALGSARGGANGTPPTGGTGKSLGGARAGTQGGRQQTGVADAPQRCRGEAPWEEIAFTEFGAISLRAERLLETGQHRVLEAFVERFELDKLDARDLI